jgi:branched-chain amino acid transport system ATP-binding protein
MTALEIDSVSVKFGQFEVVREVTFSVDSGEVVSLIGPNGAGKTTLFNVITGWVRPSAGEIRLAGQSISGFDSATISHRGVGRTWQVARPFSALTVEQNVIVGLGRSHYQSPWGLWARARTDERIHKAQALLKGVGMPPPYDRLASGLPVGHLRLLEVARVLATDPKIVLLDEPAAGLREAETAQLEELIDDLRSRGLAVLLVEHNVPLAMRVADRTVVLAEGRILADGPPEIVRQSPEVIAAYLGEPNA